MTDLFIKLVPFEASKDFCNISDLSLMAILPARLIFVNDIHYSVRYLDIDPIKYLPWLYSSWKQFFVNFDEYFDQTLQCETNIPKKYGFLWIEFYKILWYLRNPYQYFASWIRAKIGSTFFTMSAYYYFLLLLSRIMVGLPNVHL